MEVVVDDQASASIPGNQDGPLVAVTFQKKPHQPQKYLEGEPKALGVTQICLSVFQISTVLGFHMVIGNDSDFFVVSQITGALFVIIAGSIAVAAQSLHLPTNGKEHYLAEILPSNIAVVAICVTLAAYCCKTVNCCTPRANTPVITINGPPAEQ